MMFSLIHYHSVLRVATLVALITVCGILMILYGMVAGMELSALLYITLLAILACAGVYTGIEWFIGAVAVEIEDYANSDLDEGEE
jgi:ABC-type polysaccharide/polyol phosphate export permease